MADNVLDLDAILPGYLDLKKTVEGKVQTWRLYDDIPALDLLPVMHIGITESRQPTPPEGEATPDDTETYYTAFVAWRKALEDEVLKAFGTVFRHSYPEMTDEEIAKLFDHDVRYAVLRRFFRNRFSLSTVASPGNSDASTQSNDAVESSSTDSPAPTA